MGRKSVILPYAIMQAVDLTADAASQVVNIQYLDNIGITIQTDGITDNDGQFKIQISNDQILWQDVILDPAIPALADSDAQFAIALSNMPFAYLRVFFEAATGTDGTATAILTAKAL